MELFHAILYTSKNIINTNGNADLYYFYALILWPIFLIKKGNKDKIKILKCFFPLGLLAVVMLFLCSHIVLLKLFIWCIKMFLNITLLVYVSSNFGNIDVWKIIRRICCIYLFEMIIAIIFPHSYLWRLYDNVNKFSTTRLQLTYTEPSELSFHCSLLLVFIVYALFVDNIKYTFDKLFCLIITILGIILSAGMGGMLASVIAILLMCAWAILLGYRRWPYITRKMCLLICIGVGVLIPFLFTSNSFMKRIEAVFNGKDSSFNTRIFRNYEMLIAVMKKTNGVGIGFGNLNTDYGLMLAESRFPISNSFMYFITEAGVLGLLLLATFIIYIGKACFQSKDCLCVGLFSFIMIYQIAGGYFTNPVNYIIYGIILYRINQEKTMRFSGKKVKAVYSYD